MIANEHTTRVSYIEAVLGVKYAGTSINDVAEFIKEHYLKARLNEPTIKDLLHRK